MIARLEAALAEVPILDVHTHLVGGKLAARGLHDILLYHMVVSDLYAAGCPSGSRLTQYPGWPDEAEAHARIDEALPYLRHIQNTSSFWGVRIILRDLYGWTDPIDDRNWRKLDGLIRERADDRAWPHEVLDRAQIERTGTELARRGGGEDDDRLQYALEWGFFTRCQWGEFDTALYELERCWGRSAGEPRADRRRRQARHRANDPRPRRRPRGHRALCREHPLRPRSCRRPRISRPTSTTARSRTTRWPLRCPPRSGRPGRARLLCVVCQRGVPDGAGSPRRARSSSSSASAPSRCRSRPAAGCRSGRSARSPSSDRAASAAAVPVLPGQPLSQPVDVHAGARVAEFQPGRLLVAQLLSRTRSPRSSASGSRWCRPTSRSGSSPMPIASNGRMPRRSWSARSWRGCWPSGSSSASLDEPVRSGFARAILYESPQSLLGMVPRLA